MNFELDISKWRCGGIQYPQKLNGCGSGLTALKNDFCEMCCVGQFTDQILENKISLLNAGGTVSEFLEFVQIGNALEFKELTFDEIEKKLSLFSESVEGCYKNTELANNLYEINDDHSTTVSEKIKAIRTALEKHGHTLTIIHEELVPA